MISLPLDLNIPVRMQYVGKIVQLQGKPAIVRNIDKHSPYRNRICHKKHVVAQFDDLTTVFSGTRLGYGWHPFLRSDFAPLGDKPIF